MISSLAGTQQIDRFWNHLKLARDLQTQFGKVTPDRQHVAQREAFIYVH